MTKAITAPANGTFLRFALPDTDPLIFTAWCGVNNKTIKWSRNLEETVVPDCDDPNAAPYVDRGVTSQSCSIAVQGVITQQAIKQYTEMLKTTKPLYFELEMNLGGAKYKWQGQAQVSDFEMGADTGKSVTFSLNLSSHGDVEYIAPTTPNSGE